MSDDDGHTAKKARTTGAEAEAEAAGKAEAGRTETTAGKARSRITAIEFFSGIGGLHYALERALPSAAVAAAFDLNENANAVYRSNFGLKPITTGVDVLQLRAIDKLAANCWLLSPPCQPFTQGGKRLDHQDPRSRGLLHLLENVLAVTAAPPRVVFLENVPNFEVSESRRRLVLALEARGYTIQEFLVTPLQLGIPYDRRRYYLAAWLSDEPSAADDTKTPYLDRCQISTTLPSLDPTAQSQLQSHTEPEPRQLSEYLEHDLQDDTPFVVAEQVLLKSAGFRFDLVKPSDRRSACFTKAYGSHHIFASGSFLQTAKLDDEIDVADGPAVVLSRPRFFTPTEIARLHGFPVDLRVDPASGSTAHGFAFPATTKQSQQFKLLGNSLSVDVVAHLLRFLFAKAGY
ncbi:S-adenosyl-L-methionine-dependent methyltransferase [Entophlyctis helioformis]|nr:S-adenosyl-L-methionine-dependent methyltransferase [Entophlyctis helioformis]